jgi:hypothetical protein
MLARVWLGDRVYSIMNKIPPQELVLFHNPQENINPHLDNAVAR